jgi:hypothetical protein
VKNPLGFKKKRLGFCCEKPYGVGFVICVGEKKPEEPLFLRD